MRLPEPRQLGDGICRFRPRGECSLVDVVDLVNSAIEHCRDRRMGKLLFDATGLRGVSMPTLVDRFLMVEEWGNRAKSVVVVALVVHAEYIHPEKFGVKVAADFGLTMDICASEAEAIQWLRSMPAPG